MNSTMLTAVRLMLLAGLFCGVSGCVDEQPGGDRHLIPPEEGDSIQQSEMTPDEAAAALAGACPFGKICCGGRGDCSLFADLNGDGCCDLGLRDDP
ncbi:hypothetical protein [Methanocalculus chunghsingensis]|nr:hypothetical protein [Methanocalculus chunghsingensis]